MEIQFQQQAWVWGCNTYGLFGLLFHVPNEVERLPGETTASHMRRISKLKSLGLTPGVPDLVLVWNGKVYGFELKDGAKGRVSEAQEKLHEKWRLQGAIVQVCRTLDEFKKMLKEIVQHLD